MEDKKDILNLGIERFNLNGNGLRAEFIEGKLDNDHFLQV